MGERDPRPGEEHIRHSRRYVAILLPALREVARRNGYALAVHGSLERDIDLVAAPWREGATSAESLIADLFAACKAILGFATWSGGASERPEPNRKPYGRAAWSIMLSGGPYLDVSVMPRVEEPAPAPVPAATFARRKR